MHLGGTRRAGRLRRLAVLCKRRLRVLSEEDTDVATGDLLCVFPFLPSDIEPGGESLKCIEDS